MKVLVLAQYFPSGISASVELLRAINKSGLKVFEVPISCKYDHRTGEKTSTKNSVSHWVGLIMSLIKLVVKDRPLIISMGA